MRFSQESCTETLLSHKINNGRPVGQAPACPEIDSTDNTVST